MCSSVRLFVDFPSICTHNRSCHDGHPRFWASVPSLSSEKKHLGAGLLIQTDTLLAVSTPQAALAVAAASYASSRPVPGRAAAWTLGCALLSDPASELYCEKRSEPKSKDSTVFPPSSEAVSSEVKILRSVFPGTCAVFSSTHWHTHRVWHHGQGPPQLVPLPLEASLLLRRMVTYLVAMTKAAEGRGCFSS